MNGTRQPFLRLLGRAVRLRCPQCGSRRSFLRGWFHRHPRCRTCGIRWRREVGFELGAITMNTVVTFGLLTLMMTVGFVITSPEIPVLPFVSILAVAAVVVPLILYPFTYTVWLAFDLAVHPPDEVELLDAVFAIEHPDEAETPDVQRARRSR